jgi:hypothetical protein
LYHVRLSDLICFLCQCFPDATVIGVDLSPYFVTVANYRLKEHSEALVCCNDQLFGY